jgi:uncharacterized protein YkwD
MWGIAAFSDACPMPLPLSPEPHRFRLLLQTLILTVVAALAAPALASACAGADVAPSSTNVATARAATLCLLNEQRKAHGLGRLRAHRMLQNAAQNYAGQMVKGRFFDHVSPTGSTLEQRIRQNTRYLAGALRYEIGENIAWGQGVLAQPRAIVAAWMASPGHRANILRAAFREIGIGIAPGAPIAGLSGDPAVTYTNEFGTRR